MAAGHQQHIHPYGPLVLRLGPGQPGGSQLDGEVVHCGFFPPPPPPLPYCSSSSSASLLLVAAPLPSQPISSRLVRGAACSAYITRVLLQPSFLFSFLRFSSFVLREKWPKTFPASCSKTTIRRCHQVSQSVWMLQLHFIQSLKNLFLICWFQQMLHSLSEGAVLFNMLCFNEQK